MRILNCCIASAVLLLAIFFNVLAQAPETYFPESVFQDDSGNRSFILRSYSKHLSALEEPSLYQLSKDKRVHCYRFLWLRSFEHPISLRLSIDPEGTGLVSVKISNGAGGYEPGEIITNENVALSKNDVDKFLMMIKKANFWQLSTVEKTDRIGLDGAQWVFEAVRSGTYHLVDRWSPEKGSYRELALFLVRLSKLKIKHVY